MGERGPPLRDPFGGHLGNGGQVEDLDAAIAGIDRPQLLETGQRFVDGLATGTQQSGNCRLGKGHRLGVFPLLEKQIGFCRDHDIDEIKQKYDVSSLQRVSHTGAKCPVDVKRAMIDWWGPVLFEAYGASEVGTTNAISSEEWLEHPGSVGRTLPPFEAMM